MLTIAPPAIDGDQELSTKRERERDKTVGTGTGQRREMGGINRRDFEMVKLLSCEGVKMTIPKLYSNLLKCRNMKKKISYVIN